MAIIYGMADSEKNLLKKLPGEVRNFEYHVHGFPEGHRAAHCSNQKS